MTTSPVIEQCELSPLRLCYLQAGTDGPVVLLLHGWGGFKELWWSTMLALAPMYRVFALDMPAHGGSPPAGLTTMGDLARLIAAFCVAHGFASPTVVGHSLGGNVALELALLRPDLVKRLVLVDAATDALRLPLFARLHHNIGYGWASLRVRLWLNALLRLPGSGVPHLHGGGIVRPWLRRSFYMLQHDPDGLQRILLGLFANPLAERLPQVQATTLVVSGQFDTLVSPALSREVARHIHGARFVLIPGAMHNPMDEQPQLFARILLDFLRETEDSE